MNKTKKWIVSLTIVVLLASGVAALAGNGYGGNSANRGPSPAATNGSLCEREDDGVLNSEDPDWACPMDGSGYGEGKGCDQDLSANCPFDGTCCGARDGGSMGRGIGELPRELFLGSKLTPGGDNHRLALISHLGAWGLIAEMRYSPSRGDG